MSAKLEATKSAPTTHVDPRVRDAFHTLRSSRPRSAAKAVVVKSQTLPANISNALQSAALSGSPGLPPQHQPPHHGRESPLLAKRGVSPISFGAGPHDLTRANSGPSIASASPSLSLSLVPAPLSRNSSGHSERSSLPSSPSHAIVATGMPRPRLQLHQRNISDASSHSGKSSPALRPAGLASLGIDNSPGTSPNSRTRPFGDSVSESALSPKASGFRAFAAMDVTSPACRTPQWKGTLMLQEQERHRQEEERAKQVYTSQLQAYFQFPAPAVLLAEPDVRVVGRAPNMRDLDFVRLVKQAVTYSHSADAPDLYRTACSVQNLIRGTYLISYCPFEAIEALDYLNTLDWVKGTHNKALPIIAGYLGERAIFKPWDEVRGMPNCKKTHRKDATKGFHPAKDGVAPAFETANEVVASGLRDHGHLVVETTLTAYFFNRAAKHEDEPALMTKKGSLQEFLPASFASLASVLKDIDKDDREAFLSQIPLRPAQKVMILDLSLCNVDRNPHNIFIDPVTKDIRPIDQALLLPEAFGSSAEFVWMSWPQALRPFTEESTAEISGLDLARDMDRIHAAYPSYPADNLEVLQFTYYLLKKGCAMGVPPFFLGCFYTGDTLNSGMMEIYDKARLMAIRDGGGPAETRAYITKCLDYILERLRDTYSQKLPSSADADALPSVGEATDKLLSASIPDEESDSEPDILLDDDVEEHRYSIKEIRTKVERSILASARQFFQQLARPHAVARSAATTVDDEKDPFAATR